MFSELKPVISFKFEGFHIDGVLIFYYYSNLSQLFPKEQTAISN
jgi:hypothetical protein